MPPQQNLLRNRLLRQLSGEDFAFLADHLQAMDLPQHFVMATANQVIERYYFMEAGIASIVAKSPEGFKAEVGLVGRDGISPTAAVLYVDSMAFDVTVQVAGYGYALETDILKQALDRSSALRSLLGRFVHTLATQTGFTALSNANHHVDERLARWILMSHDRVEDGTIALTHDFISIMLAVRRPSVTTALHVLEGTGLIYSDRGVITVRDRAGLESFAADAYGAPEAEYERLLGPLR